MTSLGIATLLWMNLLRGKITRFCRLSLEEKVINIDMFQFDLINPKKVERKGYQNSGQIVVKSVKIEQVLGTIF